MRTQAILREFELTTGTTNYLVRLDNSRASTAYIDAVGSQSITVAAQPLTAPESDGGIGPTATSGSGTDLHHEVLAYPYILITVTCTGATDVSIYVTTKDE